MRIKFAQIIVISLFALSQSAFALEYYRYKDENGIMAIDATIPPEYVKYGYEVLNSMGLVVETVAPELSDAEKAKLEIQKQKEAKYEALKNRLNRLYRYPRDVDRALASSEERINIRIRIHNRNIEKYQLAFDQAQNDAAKAQRSGKEVPKELEDKMIEAVELMDSSQASIDAKNLEIYKNRLKLKRERDIMFEVYRERTYEHYEDEVDPEKLEKMYFVPEGIVLVEEK